MQPLHVDEIIRSVAMFMVAIPVVVVAFLLAVKTLAALLDSR